MTFSGNGFVPMFTHSLGDLGANLADGLIYVLGSPVLGDDQTHGGEGIGTGPALLGPFPPPPIFSYSYKTRVPNHL